MANYQRTVTVSLTMGEAKSIIRDALKLPPNATVTFEIGDISSDPMDRYSQQGVTGVKCSYVEGGEAESPWSR